MFAWRKSTPALRRLCTALLLGAGVAPSAWAEGPGATLCGESRALPLEELELILPGLYSVSLGPGYVVAGGMAIAHPAQASPQHGRIEWRGGKLRLVPQGGPGATLTLDWVQGETWRFDRAPTLPEGVQTAPNQTLPILPYDSDSLGVDAGCPIDDLPRLIGRGQVTIDGVAMDFTYRLMMLGPRQLAGFQEVRATARGMPVFERRPVSMVAQYDPSEDD